MTETSSSVTWQWKERLQRGFRRFGGLLAIVTLLIKAMISQVDVYVKTYSVKHFKYVHFIVCQLYLNNAVKTYSHKMISRGLPTQFCFHDFSLILLQNSLEEMSLAPSKYPFVVTRQPALGLPAGKVLSSPRND